jgi:hypothetical protein
MKRRLVQEIRTPLGTVQIKVGTQAGTRGHDGTKPMIPRLWWYMDGKPTRKETAVSALVAQARQDKQQEEGHG